MSTQAPNVAVVIQARFGSERLPGKILKDLAGKPQLQRVIERARLANFGGTVIVATTDTPADDPTESLCKAIGVPVYRGSEHDVLARMLGAVAQTDADILVRVTADCPLLSPDAIDDCVTTLHRDNLDYCIWDLDTIPLGLAAEAVRLSALQQAGEEATDTPSREHVTLYLYRNPDRYTIQKTQTTLVPNRTDLRLTVDTPEDYALMQNVYAQFSDAAPAIDLFAVADYLDANPDIRALNANVAQKRV